MIVAERQAAILTYVARNGSATVTDMCKLFEVSEMTVRRDLADLSKRGLLQRTYGGAIPSEPGFYEISSRAKSTLFVEEKERIGKAAADMINDGEVIFLDSGTTTLSIARHLRSRNITVVTNDLNIAVELLECHNVQIYVAGGNLRRGSNNLVGPKAISFFDDIRGDKVFLAVEGVDEKAGLTVPDMNEVPLKRQMVNSAGSTIVVADHSKLGRNAMGMIVPLSAAQLLITDKDAPEPIVEAIRKQIKVVLA